MSSSSQPKGSSNNLFDDVFIIGGATGSENFTITLPSDSMDSTLYTAGSDCITITSSGGTFTLNDTITLNNIQTEFNWGEITEFVNGFPDWHRIEDMCKKYPGLEIALRNFQTVYTLVKDDYDNPKDENGNS